MATTDVRRCSRWQRPKYYMGAEWPDHYVALGQHRESDSVTRSNFRTCLRDLEALPAWEGDEDSRIVVQENHWAVGWVEWIAVHKDDAAALDAVDEMLRRLDDYPVLSEEDWSELQLDEAGQYWARASVRERADIIRESGCGASIFAARRDELPQDDDGSLLEYLTRD